MKSQIAKWTGQIFDLVFLLLAMTIVIRFRVGIGVKSGCNFFILNIIVYNDKFPMTMCGRKICNCYLM